MNVQEPPADPCVLVIFGATGDLAKRKLIPSLYNMAHARLMPKEFAVIGVGREGMDDEGFRARMGEALRDFIPGPLDTALRDDLVKGMRYLSGDFGDQELYRRLKECLAEVDQAASTKGNFLFYLATPPAVFATVAYPLYGTYSRMPTSWRVTVFATCLLLVTRCS